jgi:hypothetical protein
VCVTHGVGCGSGFGVEEANAAVEPSVKRDADASRVAATRRNLGMYYLPDAFSRS